MKVGIVYKKDKIRDKNVVPSLTASLVARGHQVTPMQTGAEIHGVDCVIVLGGDGAMLHAALIAGQQNIKLVGVNYGNLGFLAEFEAKETIQVVDFLDSNYDILPRSVLKITLDDKICYALNETVIQRDYARNYGNQVAEFALCLNGRKVQDYVADGLAIATPTGSTAYSLSAGGCVLSPDLQGFIFTPICPMGLRVRPFVANDDVKVSFDLTRQREDMKLYADGRLVGNVNKNSNVIIEKAPFTADFMTRDKNKLFTALNEKLAK